MWFKSKKRFKFSKKRMIVLAVFIVLCLVLYFKFFRTINISPIVERNNMILLEDVKKSYPLDSFVTDGCSGNVSRSWKVVVAELSDIFPEVSVRYQQTKVIPFEFACVEHDGLYHKGEGGYLARLRADIELRDEILEYAITNTEEIKLRTGLKTDEAVIFLYEIISDMVYRGVRLGGAPCTGMPYAWGYGYNKGMCE